jgi:hypothetical protein
MERSSKAAREYKKGIAAIVVSERTDVTAGAGRSPRAGYPLYIDALLCKEMPYCLV